MKQAPPAPRGAQLSAPRLRMLETVARLAEATPPTIAELSPLMGGHPNSSRQLLEALVQDGFLLAGKGERAATGRPPVTYTLTTAGRRALAIAHDDPHRELLETMIEHLASQPDAVERARAMGADWGTRQGNRERGEDATTDALPVLQKTLDELGFAPHIEADEALERVVLTACPLNDLATRHPEVVCTLHGAMLNAMSAALGDGRELRLLPMAEPGQCWVERQKA